MYRSTLTFLLSASVHLSIGNAIAQEESPFLDKPLVLRVDAPKSGSIQYEDAWPLRFRLRPRDPSATTVYTFNGDEYPSRGDRAALIFSSPGTLLMGPNCSSLISTCAPDNIEPPYLEFALDEDYPDRRDVISAGSSRAPESDQPANRPTYEYQYDANDPASLRTIKLGPRLSDAIDDGIGYGPNDDLPGLVLLSNIGVGRVLTATRSAAGSAATLQEMDPRRARNLAGLMTDVSMELLSSSGNMVISTGLQVPRGLFAPIVLWDVCTEGTRSRTNCAGPMRYHIDGGPAIFSRNFSDNGPLFFSAGDSGGPDVDIFNPRPPNVVEVELVALVVNGNAPAFVDDCTGDGEINRRDLLCMGYDVISNQVRIRFIQAALFRACERIKEPWPGSDGQEVEFAEDETRIPIEDFVGEQVVVVDFDGVDLEQISFPCPTTSGRGSRPPSPP